MGSHALLLLCFAMPPLWTAGAIDMVWVDVRCSITTLRRFYELGRAGWDWTIFGHLISGGRHLWYPVVSSFLLCSTRRCVTLWPATYGSRRGTERGQHARGSEGVDWLDGALGRSCERRGDDWGVARRLVLGSKAQQRSFGEMMSSHARAICCASGRCGDKC